MKKRQSGFTLVELIVVVAIIAVLAALIVPRLDGLLGNANHAAAASSAADAAKFIEVYKSSKYTYPDGWDSLMDSSGSTLWAPSTPTTKGLHTELSNSTNGKLTTTTLTAADVTGLNNAGIYTLYNLDAGSSASTRPGDSYNTTAALASGQTVAMISPTNGTKIIDHIYRQNKLVGGTSGAMPNTSTTTYRLIAFGLGPHNAMIGKWMLEAPIYGNVDATVTYNRLLVVYELATTTSTGAVKVSFRAVLGTDGDLMDDMAASVNKSIN
jgi:prepilin-type N-terminal cleavage/methylation domain-containing protein